MDFYEIVGQAVQLLQQQRRATYRGLKFQFKLDDETLEALKEELLFSQPVVDEDGRGLVWTGETSGIQVTTSQLDPPKLQPVVEPAQPVQEASSPVALHTPEAERRQLTVMFVDLVGSTSLAGELDPEDLREVVRAYQSTCTEVVHRYDGYVAQLLGDGLLVYFGYPQAHEDDAQRAVRAGLGMVEAIGALNTHLEQDHGVTPALRLGVHTGQVVVGAMGGAGRQEQLALGETPNIAARLQGLAEPNTLLVSQATYHLIQAFFDCEALGEYVLKGVAYPLTLYQVLKASGVYSRLAGASKKGLTPLVGREAESALLFERWEQAKNGQGQVVLVSGEAGIGKSRLIQVLKDHIGQDTFTGLECYSSPYYTNTALYPIIDIVQRTLRLQERASGEEKLAQLESFVEQYHVSKEETVPLLAQLLTIPLQEEHYPPLTWTPQKRRQKTLEALLAMLLELAEHQPLLFVVEDLHWTDPTTLEFLTLLIDQIPTTPLFLFLTTRPDFVSPWGSRSYLTPLTLHRLSPALIGRLAIQTVGGKNLPEAVIEQIVQKTDGVPLFIEELTKSVIDSGIVKETDGHYELTGALTAFSIPTSLQDSLMARLDRLATVKRIAQIGAVIGRQFSYELLQAVAELDDATLQHALQQLVEAELLYQRGFPPQATYLFKHALIQDTSYQSLLKSSRQKYHQNIADILATQFPETSTTQPELLAHHYTAAGLGEIAIPYWQQAGNKAQQGSAHKEAITYFTTALEVLHPLPETEARLSQEIVLQRSLGVSLLAIRGFAAPEVAAAYSRARELCQRVGNIDQLFPVLFGLWGFHHLKMEWQRTRDLAEELLTLVHQHQTAGHLLMAHRALGDTLHWLGEFGAAREHLEQGIALYDAERHRSYTMLYGQDPLIGCQCYMAETLWMLGYPEQALRMVYAAIASAEQVAHPFSVANALTWSYIHHGRRREWQLVLEQAEKLRVLTEEQGFSQWLAQSKAARNKALIMLGQHNDLEQMRQGNEARRRTGARHRVNIFVGDAEALRFTGQAAEGLEVINQGLLMVEETGEGNYEAEVYRLKGELLLELSEANQPEAENCFRQALSIARTQQAKSWELRAATSLARLWQAQNKRKDAYDLLVPLYSWFTEGFNTADLKDAKVLLDELD